MRLPDRVALASCNVSMRRPQRRKKRKMAATMTTNATTGIQSSTAPTMMNRITAAISAKARSQSATPNGPIRVT